MKNPFCVPLILFAFGTYSESILAENCEAGLSGQDFFADLYQSADLIFAGDALKPVFRGYTRYRIREIWKGPRIELVSIKGGKRINPDIVFATETENSEIFEFMPVLYACIPRHIRQQDLRVLADQFLGAPTELDPAFPRSIHDTIIAFIFLLTGAAAIIVFRITTKWRS